RHDRGTARAGRLPGRAGRRRPAGARGRGARDPRAGPAGHAHAGAGWLGLRPGAGAARYQPADRGDHRGPERPRVVPRGQGARLRPQALRPGRPARHGGALPDPGGRPAAPVSGDAILVRKLGYDGREIFRWTGRLVARDAEGVIVEAPFNVERVDLGYVVLERGDLFVEF